MTSSADLMQMVFGALLGAGAAQYPPVYATGAGARIYRPGDWPTQNDQYPILKIRVTRETKQSIARSTASEFTVTTTIRIEGQVSAPADVNDAGAAVAEAALWALQRQVEIAVIGSYPLTSEIQQIATVDSQLSYNSDAETHLAGIQIDVGLEFYQGPEDFAPIASDALTQAHGELTSFPNHPGFTVDLQQ